MASTSIDVSLNKYYPEELIGTFTSASLGTGSTDMIDIKNINSDSQIMVLQEFAADSVSGINITAKQRNIKGGQMKTTDTIQSLQTMGIGYSQMINGDHPYKYIGNEFILGAVNNSGSAYSNYRSRVNFVIDAFDSLTKKTLGYPFNARDRECWSLLKAKAGSLSADPDVLFALGQDIPPNWNEFLEIHQVIDSHHYTLADATTLSTTNTYLVNDEPKQKGETALVCESLYIQRPTQSQIGQVNVSVYRDSQPTAVLSFDPACLPDAPKANAETVGNGLAKLDCHIHAFEQLQVVITASSGTWNNFKAYAQVTERPAGLLFKAKLNEFLGTNGLPTALQYTDAEKALVQKLMLQEMLRVGIIHTG